MRDIYYYEIRKRIEEIRNLEQSTASEEVLSPSATESTANKNMLVKQYKPPSGAWET